MRVSLRYTLPHFLPTVVLLVSTSCSGLQKPEATCGPVQAQPVPIVRVLQGVGAGSELSERLLVIRNQSDLAEAWGKLFDPNPAPPVPSVDFQDEMVIIYAMGTQPSGCYSAEIEGVRGAGPELLVSVREVEPERRCTCTFNLVMPFEVIRLTSHAGPVSLCVRRTVLQCR